MQLQWSAFVVCARRVRDEGDVADAFALRSAAFVRACCLPARRVCVATMGAPAVLVPTGAGQQTNQAPHVVSACLLIKGHGLMAARLTPRSKGCVCLCPHCAWTGRCLKKAHVC